MTRLSLWLEPINCQLVMDDTFGARWIEGETKRAERVRSERLIRNNFVTAEEGVVERRVSPVTQVARNRAVIEAVTFREQNW